MIRTIAMCEAQVPFVHGGAEPLFHQYRAIYDLCGTVYSEFSHTESDVRLRAKLMELDRGALGESAAIFSIAPNPAARLAHYNGLDARFAQSLGDAGYERARTISWDGVIERLIKAGSR